MNRYFVWCLVVALACSDDASAPTPSVRANETAASPTEVAPNPTVSPTPPPPTPTPTPSTTPERPNLASFAQGAVLVRSEPVGAWDVLDEFAGTTWSRDDGVAEASAVIELATRTRVEQVRITLDDYWTVRLPNEVVVELGDAAAGPFREVAKLTLPATLPETGDAPFVATLPVSGVAGRYVQVRLVGRRGGAEEPLGPFLTDLGVYGTAVAPVVPESAAVGRWNGGWLLGTFEVRQDAGRLRVCFERDGADGDVVVDGRTVQLRWKPEGGGEAVALLVRGADDHLHGTLQTWDAEGQGGEPGSVDVERTPGEPICAREPAPSAIERALEADRRARVYGILFDFAQHVPRAESTAVLDELAAVLARHGDWQVTVEGHTDAVGDDASNVALSQRRAAAVVEALVARGVAADRMTSEGVGEARPVGTNDTALGRARNRRVEIALR